MLFKVTGATISVVALASSSKYYRELLTWLVMWDGTLIHAAPNSVNLRSTPPKPAEFHVQRWLHSGCVPYIGHGSRMHAADNMQLTTRARAIISNSVELRFLLLGDSITDRSQCGWSIVTLYVLTFS